MITPAGRAVQNILEVVDWSKEEKAKIWEAALDANGKYHDLTFDEFKVLIQGEGGYNLVERMAAGAGAVHIERISGPQPPLDPPLSQLNGLLREGSSLPCALESTALQSEPSRGDLSGSGAQASADMSGVRWAGGPERQPSAAGATATDAEDGDDDDGTSSSDSEDEGGKKKPALLTKRRGELRRGQSVEGGTLRSPQRSAKAMLAAAQSASVDTSAAPSELPRNRSASGAVDAESAGLSGGSPLAVPPSPVFSKDRSQGSACTTTVESVKVRAVGVCGGRAAPVVREDGGVVMCAWWCRWSLRQQISSPQTSECSHVLDAVQKCLAAAACGPRVLDGHCTPTAEACGVTPARVCAVRLACEMANRHSFDTSTLRSSPWREC